MRALARFKYELLLPLIEKNTPYLTLINIYSTAWRGTIRLACMLLLFMQPNRQNQRCVVSFFGALGISSRRNSYFKKVVLIVWLGFRHKNHLVRKRSAGKCPDVSFKISRFGAIGKTGRCHVILSNIWFCWRRRLENVLPSRQKYLLNSGLCLAAISAIPSRNVEMTCT